MSKQRLLVLGSVVVGLRPALCAAQSPGESCSRLKDAIPASAIGLPSGGAVIDSAELMPPAPLAAAQLPFGPLPSYLAVVPATPGYCKVLGAIAPVDPKAPPIGGAVISPGDIVVGDEDGVVSFSQAAAPALLEAVKAQVAREEATLVAIREGRYRGSYGKA